MPDAKQRVPAIDGWFTLDDEPRLLGGRCGSCGTIVFPRRGVACPNPSCAGTELEPTPLSRTGRVWSYATNHYPPPEPYVASDPFQPYTIAAVELTDERIVVLGQVPRDVDVSALSVGQEMVLDVGTLYSDDDTDYLVWMWRPAEGSS